MKRGKSQVLFRYLPECVIDHSDTQTIAKITKWNTKQLENFNKTRIVAELGRRLNRYPRKRIYPNNISSDAFVFLEPTSIEAELFPLTFICKKCRKAYSFNSIENFSRTFQHSNYACIQSGCGGRLEQMDLVNYHKCGKIESPKVQRCPEHGYERIVLEKNSSDQPGSWRWHCAVCNRDIAAPTEAFCQDCQKRMDTAPFRKSQVFYPHSFTLINTSGFSESRHYKDIGSYKLLLAVHLGIADAGELRELLESTQESARTEEYHRIREKLRKKGTSEELIAELLETLSEDDGFARRLQALDSVEAAVPLAEDRLRALGMVIQEYQETINLTGVKTIDATLREAQDRRDPSWSKIELFPERLSNIGVLNAYAVSDLPIMSAVYGYSRVTADPSECTLRCFTDWNYPGKTPIFINSSETEGIILEFDRRKILKWLSLNGIIQSVPEMDNEIAIRSWFLKEIDPDLIPIYDEIPDLYPVTKMVYKLIHSISHMLLRTAAGLAGLDKDSLGEIVMPNIPAVIIYANNIHDFQIGGMHTLFESSIIPWIDMAMMDAENCLYDPVCIDNGGSCHACLQISEVSCAHFNRDLGRDVLAGFENDTNRITGFWEKDFIKTLGA
jgi:hypothetical protein